MRRAWSRSLVLFAAVAAFLPAVRAHAQADCEALKKAFEEARAEYRRAHRAYDDAWQACARKSLEIRELEKLQEMQAKLAKAKDDVEKWKSKNEPSLEKEHQVEVDYWTREISTYRSQHPDVGSPDTLDARILEMRRELKADEENRTAKFQLAEAARGKYEKASLAYQACHPDEHAKIPPGTCESQRKEAERIDSEFHRKDWKGVDPETFNRADKGRLDAHKRYCQCLWDHDVRPLPSECSYYEPYEPFSMRIESGYRLPPPNAAPPPSSKSAAAPPPPSRKSLVPASPPAASPVPPGAGKSGSAPPPPPPAVPPPPGAAAPPASNTSTYVCGKSPCDCSKQNPRKVCKPGSGCVCTKG